MYENNDKKGEFAQEFDSQKFFNKDAFDKNCCITPRENYGIFSYLPLNSVMTFNKNDGHPLWVTAIFLWLRIENNKSKPVRSKATE